MATDGATPPPCDDEIFRRGEPIAAVDGRSNAIERWVKRVAQVANARVDWHYSGGRGHVLHLGDAESRGRVMQAVHDLEPELDGRILKLFHVGDAGLFRNGVTHIPGLTYDGDPIRQGEEE